MSLPTLRDGWIALECVKDENGLVTLLAAKCEDGVGVMARWWLDIDDLWVCLVWDTDDEPKRDSLTMSVPRSPPLQRRFECPLCNKVLTLNKDGGLRWHTRDVRGGYGSISCEGAHGPPGPEVLRG